MLKRIIFFSFCFISFLLQNIYWDTYRYCCSFVVFIMSPCYDDCVCIQMNFAINVHISIGGHA